MASSSPPLLALEGPEGAGKTTQLRRLSALLAERGVAHEALREPGGTALGDDIRRLLLEPGRDIAPRAEALLFMASRAQLVQHVLLPARQAGKVVLLDRFFLSTYAYQIDGRELPEEEIRRANALATAGLVPDLTVLLAVPAAEARRRRELRGVADRMEAMGDGFHRRVDAAFARFASPEWQRAHPECGPIVAVRADGTEDDVFARIRGELTARWPDLFGA
ncbi:MAG TPA: dTMP kinase [Gemmatimonadaceae bacterium]|nr:dTMP kinase [Gemmatimonadaceae bacterium]